MKLTPIQHMQQRLYSTVLAAASCSACMHFAAGSALSNVFSVGTALAVLALVTLCTSTV